MLIVTTLAVVQSTVTVSIGKVVGREVPSYCWCMKYEWAPHFQGAVKQNLLKVLKQLLFVPSIYSLIKCLYALSFGI